jgi:transcriptional regulator with XRE-family HTH domain
MLLGMSQEKLGEKLGLTFQQVQKYEKGVNRISASRLFHMAEALDVPIQFFFDDLPRLSKVEPLVAPQREHSILAFFRDRDAIELQKAFDGVSDPDVRKTLVAHVRALAECGSA